MKYRTFFLLVLFFLSCQKSEFIKEPSKWKLVKYRVEDRSFVRAKNNYFLEFMKDSIIKVQLDVNICQFSCKSTTKGHINIQVDGCTYACCDSEYAEGFRSLLPMMSNYYYKGNRLYFEGHGEIVLVEN